MSAVLDAAPAPPEPAPPRRAWSLQVHGGVGLLLALPLVAMLALLVGYPLVRILVDSVSDGAGLSRYVDVLTYPVSRRALTTTLVDSLVVTVLATACALSLAWFLHTTTRRWTRVLLWTVALVPLWMGVTVKNYAMFILLSGNGPINSTLLTLGLIDQPLPLLYNDVAVIAGITYSLVPYAVLSVYATVSQVDAGLLTAAQSMGAARAQALGGVAWPLVRGGVITSMALVFILSIGFYVTPILLGGPQTAFMATYVTEQISKRYDYAGAAASASVLLIVAVVVVGAVLALVGRSTFRKALS